MRLRLFLIYLALIASTIDYSLINLGVNIRMSHFVVILFLFNYILSVNKTHFNKTQTERKLLNILLLVFIVIIPLNIIITFYLYKFERVSLYISLLINFVNFYLFYSLISKETLNSVHKILKVTLIASFLFYGIDAISYLIFSKSLFSNYVMNEEGYKLGAIFFNDVNWEAGFILFISIFYISFSRMLKLNYSYVATLSLLVLIYSASRISLLLFLIYIYYISDFRKRSIIIILGSIALIGLAYVGFQYVFSEDYYYDITYLERNPRLNDFNAIYDEMLDKSQVLFGSGFGNMQSSAYYITWREQTAVSNVLLIQIFSDYGLVGSVLSLLLFAQIFVKLKSKNQKIIFIFILAFLMFHNMLYKNLFWILLGVFFILIKWEGYYQDERHDISNINTF